MIHHYQSFHGFTSTLPVVYAVTLSLSIACEKDHIICRCRPLLLIYVCILTGQRSRRSSSRRFQTIANLYFCPDSNTGAEEVARLLLFTTCHKSDTKNVANVFASPAFALSSVLEDISRLLCADIHGDAIIEAAKGLLSHEQTSKRRKILSDLLQNLEDRSELETRDEDKDWFKGRLYDSCT